MTDGIRLFHRLVNAPEMQHKHEHEHERLKGPNDRSLNEVAAIAHTGRNLQLAGGAENVKSRF